MNSETSDSCSEMRNLAVVLLCLLAFSGCSTHPVTDAVCLSQCLDSWDKARVLVWTNEPALEPLLVHWVEAQGGQVVDTLTLAGSTTPDDLRPQPDGELDQFLRQFGRRAGASRVLAARVERRSYPLYNLYSGYKEGHPRVTTFFDPTVTIRSLNVADRTTQWSVTAKGGSTSFVYDPAVIELAETALERAACEADHNSRWTDERGCSEKSRA